MIYAPLVAFQTLLKLTRFAFVALLGVGRERKGKAQAESKGKAKADAKKGNKREPSELEKSLKGDKQCINHELHAIDATPARRRAAGGTTHWLIYAQAIK